MTRPEGVLLGMAIVLFGMLAFVAVLVTVTIMAVRLSNLRRAATDAGEKLQERRRIVKPSLMIIGVAGGLWAILVALDIWWNIIRDSIFERMFMLHQ